MQLHEASPIAARVWQQLQPLCRIINTAGSIRRCKTEVKDIEIVAIPNLKELITYDLFQTKISTMVPNPDWVATVKSLGTIEMGKPGGRYMKILLPEGIKLDLFTPQPADYWRLFAMRTGSADYSKHVIATAWVRKGWVGTHDGLRLKKQCIEGSDGWKCVAPKPTLPPVWRSEPEFFEWLNVPYVSPDRREV